MHIKLFRVATRRDGGSMRQTPLASRAIIAGVKLFAMIAASAMMIACPPDPADPGNGNGNGTGNGTETTIPEVPAGLVAIPGDGQITLTWNESTRATGYAIFRGRSRDSIEDAAIATISAGSTIEHIDTDPENGQTYHYAIAATNSAGSSARSEIVQAIAGDILVIAIDGDFDAPGDQPIMAIREHDSRSVHIIARLRSTFADGAPTTGDIVYEIIKESPDEHPLSVIGNELRDNTSMVDYETDPIIRLTIRASNNSNGLTGSLDIAVPIFNVDDEAPIFDPFPAGIFVENGTTRFSIGSATTADSLLISATDDLGDEIKYAFLNSDGTTTDTTMDFRVDSSTGEVAIATAPTYESEDLAANRRVLAIQARDTSPNAVGDIATRAEIAIVITPTSELDLTSSAGLSFAIDESDDAPIMGVTAISFADGDRSPTTDSPYTLLGGDAGFSITAAGAVAASIDYESLTPSQQDNGLLLVVQGEDSTGAFGVISLIITITNIDDEAPVFVSVPTAAAITEGTTSFQGGAIVIRAADDLGDEIGYAFLNGDGTTTDTTADVSLDYNTGVLAVATAPTYDSGDLAANRRVLAIRASDRSPGAVGTADAAIIIEVVSVIDSDGDGLIDIDTLEALDNMRYNLEGTGYKNAADGPDNTTGCPDSRCVGYELTRSLDFAEAESYASGAVNIDWMPNASSPDSATNNGWIPVGDLGNRFNAQFEGNGHTIRNLYTRGDGEIGLFGATGQAAVIRRFGLVESASYGGDGNDDYVGTIVGYKNGGFIIASYATGTAHGGGGVDDFDSVGGLVGYNEGFIVASYATGTIDDDDLSNANLGGLVGFHNGSEDAEGGQSTIIASYATGDINVPEDSLGNPGALAGNPFGVAESIFASYGFGDFTIDSNRISNTLQRVARSPDANPDIHSPAILVAENSSTNPEHYWDESVWNFGDDTQYPVLNWITAYNHADRAFSCDQALLPEGATCGTPMPGQYDSDGDGSRDRVPEAPIAPPMTNPRGAAGIEITWTQHTGAIAYRLYRGSTAESLGSVAITEIADGQPLSYNDIEPRIGANYYAVSAINDFGEGSKSPAISGMTGPVDSDGDGLIEIETLEALNNMRYNLEGTGYKIAADGSDNTAGCPDSRCIGYELTRSLDFAEAASYASGAVNTDWMPNAANPDDATNAGWIPIGDCKDNTDEIGLVCEDRQFTAIFAGNGHTIANLYIREENRVGLFSFLSADAEIRNVGLIAGNSYGISAGINKYVGALVGQNDGTIIASYATGTANGDDRASDNVGALVGRNGGTIVASYATEPPIAATALARWSAGMTEQLSQATRPEPPIAATALARWSAGMTEQLSQATRPEPPMAATAPATTSARWSAGMTEQLSQATRPEPPMAATAPATTSARWSAITSTEQLSQAMALATLWARKTPTQTASLPKA